MQHTVLVVEDDPACREAIIVVLEQAGYEVIAAVHGQMALELLRYGAVPRLIVLDLMMPVMDGWQFRQHQLADPKHASIPVIVLSADPAARRLVGSPGVRRVLKKPMDCDEFLRTVACACAP
jgi:CheY-like chemotaxis protein